MPSFDFITEADFRKSLESDFEEMRKSIEGGAWKSAQVIAGSIVEALLIDYLVSVPHQGRPAKNPLAMDLAEAISICRQERVLTDRTADLCSVVRSYRNLIHPGRLVRLEEPPPARESASIALSLVEIITEEIARTRRKLVGLTAEQLLSKIERDAEVLSFFKHLVLEASELQRTRLILDLIPAAHARHMAVGDFESWTLAERLASAYEITLSTVSEEIKGRAVAEFVRVLREEDGPRVSQYASAFFRAALLAYVPETQRPLVSGYLLNRLDSDPSGATLKMVDGIEEFLSPSDAGKWVDPLTKVFVNSKEADLRRKVRSMISWAEISSTDAFLKAVRDRLQTWKEHYAKAGSSEKAQSVEELIAAVSSPE
jgi:hypothetical protein